MFLYIIYHLINFVKWFSYSAVHFLLLYKDKLLILFSLLKTFYFIYIFIMPVKKTVQKKTATKAAAKPTTKHVNTANVVEVKKPTVVVETKKTDRCECGDNCNCWCSCNSTSCLLKIIILILVCLNLVISCICCTRLCSKKSAPAISGKSAWDLEALKVWWEENLEKLKNELYSTDAYKQAQKESIESYMQQLWIE